MFICTPIVYIVVRIKKIGGVLAAVLSAIIYLLAFYYLKDPDMPMEGFIFGYIPALQASKLNPIDALLQE